jgi:hypothetical protein
VGFEAGGADALDLVVVLLVGVDGTWLSDGVALCFEDGLEDALEPASPAPASHPATIAQASTTSAATAVRGARVRDARRATTSPPLRRRSAPVPQPSSRGLAPS